MLRMLILICVLATAVTADPAWLADVERDLATPGGGAKAVASLEALPLDQRQSRDYHWALARALLADGKHGPAAESLRVFELLPPAAPDRDIDAMKKATRARALEEYQAAMAALAKSDQPGAVKAYLRASMMDPGIQAKDDAGLREVVVKSLDNAVAKKSDDAALRFRHAMCAYLFGRLPESEASFEAFQKVEKVPYYAWRGKLWQDKVKAERGAMRAQDEQNAQAESAQRAKQAALDLAARASASASPSAASAAAAPPDESPELAQKRAGLRAELEKVELAIVGASNTDAIKEAAGEAGKKYGKLIDRYVNSGAGQKKIEELKKRKEELEAELASLK